PYAFITDNFDALAARVDADAPGGWPDYAEALCSEGDRASVAAFWRDRAGKYAGADHNVAQALEVIASCSALRARERARMTAFLARYWTVVPLPGGFQAAVSTRSSSNPANRA